MTVHDRGGAALEVEPPAVVGFAAVVLAAGLSRRMGAPNKLLLPLRGQPLIARVVDQVLGAGVSEVVVVLGHQAEAVREAIAPYGVRAVHNEQFNSGQVSSVRAGLGALVAPASAVVICLGDQPLLTTADLRRLLEAYARRPSGSILVPVRGEQRGNPVVVDWASARETLARGQNFGCRHLIEQHPERVYRWPAPNDHFVRDVDEPSDYQNVLASPGS